MKTFECSSRVHYNNYGKHLVLYQTNKQTKKQKSTQPNWKYVGENIADVAQMLSFVFDSVENIDGKKRKCWLPAFPLILAMFSKGFCSAQVAQW